MYSSSSICMSSSESLSCWFSGSSRLVERISRRSSDVSHCFVFQRKLSARALCGVERPDVAALSDPCDDRFCASRAFSIISIIELTAPRRSISVRLGMSGRRCAAIFSSTPSVSMPCCARICFATKSIGSGPLPRASDSVAPSTTAASMANPTPCSSVDLCRA